MTTATAVADRPQRRSVRAVSASLGARAAVRWSSARKRSLVTGAKAIVATIRGRFTLSQLAGGSTASAGVFVLWGLGVGLLVVGLAVLGASVFLERLRG